MSNKLILVGLFLCSVPFAYCAPNDFLELHLRNNSLLYPFLVILLFLIFVFIIFFIRDENELKRINR
jgi:hypothetical protein